MGVRNGCRPAGAAPVLVLHSRCRGGGCPALTCHPLPGASGIRLVPTSNTTREMMGVKEVAILGGDDKRQITGVLAVAADGTVLPPQLIFQGSTPGCLPFPLIRGQAKFAGWSWAYTSNHWANLGTMQQYVREIIVPYFQRRISQASLPSHQKCVILMDCWVVHKSAEFRAWLREEYPWLLFLYVPAGCTGKAQVRCPAALNAAACIGCRARRAGCINAGAGRC